MPHQHMAHHHVARQRNRNDDGVATSVSIVVVTLPNTFTGDVIWVTQKERPTQLGNKPGRQTSTIQQEQAKPTSTNRALPKPTTRASSSPTPTSESSTASETESSSSASSSSLSVNTTTLMRATSSPSPSAQVAAASESPSASSSATPSATAAPASSGMSGGAKAGLALGILFAIGALLAAVLLVYHRKKKAKAAQKIEVDNEKNFMKEEKEMPAPPPDSPRTTRTLSTAPRLSLRPVTQFSPTLPENRKSAGNTLDVAAALAPTRERTPSPRSTNGANAEAQNPFGDPQNPFGNDAAISTPQSSTPATPSHSGPELHLNDFANPASAIAAADATSSPSTPVVVTPVPTSIPRKEVPAPLSIRSEAGAMSVAQPSPSFAQPSPAWTEDLPASPGPAPSGPPPIAVAGGPVNSTGPASPVNNVHRVQLDFKPSMNDELELHAGQLVRMLHEYDDGWALCIRMDRSQQGVVPRTCLSKHPVKPRNGPPRQGPPGPPRTRGPPPMHVGVPQPRPLTPNSGRNSPHPPAMMPANGRMSPAPRAMSPRPRAMSPGPRMAPGPRPMSPASGPRASPPRSMSPSPRSMSPAGGPRGRSNSNAPYAGPQRSMSPGPYGGSYQPPQAPMGRPRANSTGQVAARRGPAPGPSPMNPNAPMPSRKPLPGQAI